MDLWNVFMLVALLLSCPNGRYSRFELILGCCTFSVFRTGFGIDRMYKQCTRLVDASTPAFRLCSAGKGRTSANYDSLR
eukprot:6363048-Amphidinium_carterae.1